MGCTSLCSVSRGLDLLNGASRIERGARQSGHEGCGGTDRPGCLGMRCGQAPLTDWSGKRPLEADQSHLVGTGFDTCFQTWLQPHARPWAQAASPIDSVCHARDRPRERLEGGCPSGLGRLPRGPAPTGLPRGTFCYGEAGGEREGKGSQSPAPEDEGR